MPNVRSKIVNMYHNIKIIKLSKSNLLINIKVTVSNQNLNNVKMKSIFLFLHTSVLIKCSVTSLISPQTTWHI